MEFPVFKDFTINFGCLNFGCFDFDETFLATLPASEGFNLIPDSERCSLELGLATGSVCMTDRNRLSK